MLNEKDPSSSQWLVDPLPAVADRPSLCTQLTNTHGTFLMDTYIANVDQFIRILHKGTVVAQTRQFAAGVGEPGFEAQLSAVYNLALLSLTEKDCSDRFRESRVVLLNRCREDVERGLSALKVTTTHQLSTLQTLLLHIVSDRLPTYSTVTNHQSQDLPSMDRFCTSCKFPCRASCAHRATTRCTSRWGWQVVPQPFSVADRASAATLASLGLTRHMVHFEPRHAKCNIAKLR